MTEKKLTFSAKEHLKSRKEISRIFTNGIFLYSDFIILKYLPGEHQKMHKLAVSVPKRLFKSAVIRNKLKRRIRESYRLNKYILYDYSEKSKVFFNFLVIYKHKEILPYQKIEEHLVILLNKLIEQA
ncbi:MAG: ribonuclease P protein component [Bacteroidetes bacterium]|nr:ribonuclease P protein component [Bacteroidales bacterium]RLD49755.1 MAG: ribonuclease P protein component [Bacteroidota bacterium]